VQRRGSSSIIAEKATDVSLDLPQRRVIEYQRLRQLGVAETARQLAPKLNGAERVEPRLHQRRVERGIRREELVRHVLHSRRHLEDL
jgi:hypothetical protein